VRNDLRPCAGHRRHPRSLARSGDGAELPAGPRHRPFALARPRTPQGHPQLCSGPGPVPAAVSRSHSCWDDGIFPACEVKHGSGRAAWGRAPPCTPSPGDALCSSSLGSRKALCLNPVYFSPHSVGRHAWPRATAEAVPWRDAQPPLPLSPSFSQESLCPLRRCRSVAGKQLGARRGRGGFGA